MVWNTSTKDSKNHQTGLVIKVTGKWCEIMNTSNREISPAVLCGKLRQLDLRSTHPVAVGDRVAFSEIGKGNPKTIESIYERKNYIVRKAVRKGYKMHILAANIDQAVLIISLSAPRTSTTFIDKFLLVAESYQVPTLIVFNKIDLQTSEEKLQCQKLRTLYENLGYSCRLLSLKDGVVSASFFELLRGKISLLSGHSGVGKSTLINAIIPTAQITTQEISSAYKKGKHTTTFSQAHICPDGALIIDTPGIKEFRLFDTKKEYVFRYFREILNFAQNCKYTNCMHVAETECSVKEAVEQHLIAPSRYQSYLNTLKYDFDLVLP